MSYAGYQFRVPISTFKIERQFDRGVVLSFSDCGGMTLFTSNKDFSLVGAMRQSATKKQNNIETIVGTEAVKSDYSLRSKILNLTPASLSLFTLRTELAGNSVLLVLKKVEIERFKNGLYNFQTQWIRGFQEGDISRDRGVVVEGYDAQDRQVMLIIGNRLGKSCFGQAQLNEIISTLQPAAD